jgi:hypothetical protein
MGAGKEAPAPVTSCAKADTVTTELIITASKDLENVIFMGITSINYVFEPNTR